MAKAFLSLYPRRQSYIQKLPSQERWSQKKGTLRDYQLLGVIEDGGRGLWRGCYWGEETRFAVLDIDHQSNYHSAQELKKIREILAGVSLADTAYRSSESGGWHLYLPFTDWVSSEEVETTLKQFFKAQGYSIQGGELEIFPANHALRLPLQPGFAWLTEHGQVETRREDIEKDEALRRFLNDFQTHENNWSEAKDLINSYLVSHREAQEARHREVISTEGFDGLWNNGRIKERIEEARFYLDYGLTEAGQRHSAIYAIEHLLWFGDADRSVPKLPGSENDQRREQYLIDWLEKNHNGYCRHVNRGNWRLLEGHIRRACEWRGSNHQAAYEKTPYAITDKSIDVMVALTKSTGHIWTPEDLERANQKREKEARAKIKKAVSQFEREGRKLTIKGLALASGCDRKTVRKHSDIHQIGSSNELSKWGSHIDPVLGASVSTVADQPLSGEFDPDQTSPEFLTSGQIPSDLEILSSSECESDVELRIEQDEVAPLLSFLAQEPITSPQCQNQASEVVLTPGPRLRDIQSGTAGVQGGDLFYVLLRTERQRGPP